MRVEYDAEGLEGQLASVHDAIAQALTAVSSLAGAPENGYAEVLLVDREEIHEMNRQHRGVDAPTDVLSFPMIAYPPGTTAQKMDWVADTQSVDPQTGEIFLGDIVISWSALCNQAEEYGHSRAREAGFLAAHALLHLLGFDHEDPQQEEIMNQIAEQALHSVGLVR